MRPRQLEYVVAVAAEGSFTDGARAARVSQPALSHQVKALEQELGRALFVRTPEGAVPTPEGERFLPHARAALTAYRAAAEAARAAARLEGGELRVAALHSMAMGLVPPALGAWRRAHPAVRVALTEYAHIDLLAEAMAGGEADIAVGTDPEGWPGPRHVLGEEELLLVLPADEPLLRRPGGVPLALLADRPWVLYAADFGLSPLVARAFAQAGFAPRAAARVHHTATAVELAAAGLGPALVPADVIGARHAAHTARPATPVVRRLVAFTRPDPSPAALAFTALLAAQTARPVTS
ncbi:LysR family transcriptional regulator [Actinocorallia sp. API 0066]|uniref:LysR family transcriptional regulator n=1 Tax=Actinocorallia sp. API 0066 TaxID=2896846 RepID=UPI001E3BCB56|nr:LysR family transcriptional regulator [Actinocorallia sp. API 0066]MCD0449639.1 LysR family transcriptional regulator [Actinocorallia sp. API 0066]